MKTNYQNLRRESCPEELRINSKQALSLLNSPRENFWEVFDENRILHFFQKIKKSYFVMLDRKHIYLGGNILNLLIEF